jgi:hypothetical protein
MMVFRRAREPFMAQLGAPGTWDRSFAGGKPKIVLCCPSCKTVLGIDQHVIDAEGNVSPSCMCPITGCDFHEYVKLEDWVDTEGVTREKITATEGVPADG